MLRHADWLNSNFQQRVVSEVHLRMLSGWLVATRHVIMRMHIYQIRSTGHVLGGVL